MLEEVITELIITLVVFGCGFFVIMIVFKNDQKNANQAMRVEMKNINTATNVRIDIVEKDVKKNDERMREDFNEERAANKSAHDSMFRELRLIKDDVNRIQQDNIEFKAEFKGMLSHFDRTLSGVSGKVDLIFETLVKANKAGGTNEKSKG